MMNIDHIAIWVKDLEKMKSFYVKYFGGKSNEKYVNSSKHFSSYFISLDGGCKIELMHRPEISSRFDELQNEYLGLTHFAISLGSKYQVDALTKSLRNDGYKIVGELRTTGDGYYESVVLDPENNRIELTI